MDLKKVQQMTNFLLTESAVIMWWNIRSRFWYKSFYIKDRGLIFSRNDQAIDQVNKKFIVWLLNNIYLTHV